MTGDLAGPVRTQLRLVLHLPLGWVLTSNQRHRSWHARHGRTANLRALARAKGMSAVATHRAMSRHDPAGPVFPLASVHVLIEWRWRDHGRRRDPLNWAPTAKALIDGLTDVGLWPDDSARHLTGPDLRAADPSTPTPADAHMTAYITITDTRETP